MTRAKIAGRKKDGHKRLDYRQAEMDTLFIFHRMFGLPLSLDENPLNRPRL